MELKLSVVICAYNREDHIERTLDSLYNQSAPKTDYEVIVIDNNSKDRTSDICKEFIKNHPDFNISYFLETNQGLSFARNRGIKEANYQIISYIDDDGLATNNYVESLLDFFTNNREAISVGGKVIPIYPSGNEPVWMSKYLWGIVAKIDQGNSMHEFKYKYPAGCNMAFNKEIFDKYGMFNEDIKYRGDEKFMFLKLKKGKELIMYDPEIVVYHSIPETRLTHESFVKICKNVGESEKTRTRDQSIVIRIIKLAEFAFKLGASFLIGIKFVLKGQPQKANYLIQAMFYILVGLIKK